MFKKIRWCVSATFLVLFGMVLVVPYFLAFGVEKASGWFGKWANTQIDTWIDELIL